MKARGRKHDWRFVTIWDHEQLVCRACGLLGEAVTTQTAKSIGWSGRPFYGCLPSPNIHGDKE